MEIEPIKRYAYILPNGDVLFPDHSYSLADYKIGEKIIFEGEETIYLIADIQHQVRSENVKYIMANIILKKIST